jgi:hypothetical protein
VCLATCLSQAGLFSASEGMLGLQQAFLEAGAQSVLVSLWPVDDRATFLLMREFYARLLDPARLESPCEALRGAQRAVRGWRDARGATPYAHPVYWAGFILVGAGERGGERPQRSEFALPYRPERHSPELPRALRVSKRTPGRDPGAGPAHPSQPAASVPGMLESSSRCVPFPSWSGTARVPSFHCEVV